MSPSEANSSLAKTRICSMAPPGSTSASRLLASSFKYKGFFRLLDSVRPPPIIRTNRELARYSPIMTLPAADTLAALRGRLAALEAARLAFTPAQATEPGPLACCGAGAFPGALHEVA